MAANCHQFSSKEKKNVKFVSPDGKREVVYNGLDRFATIVTDLRDIGSYNFVPSNKGTFGWLGHTTKDIIPWILWGNSEGDTTTSLERIRRMLGW